MSSLVSTPSTDACVSCQASIFLTEAIHISIDISRNIDSLMHLAAGIEADLKSWQKVLP